MELYLAAEPRDLDRALGITERIVHLLCRIGQDNTLLTASLPEQAWGGLAALTDRDAPLVTAPEKLARELAALCHRHHFGGVVLDLEGPRRRDLDSLARCLDGILRAQKKVLFLPEGYTNGDERSTVFISTALSGGTLEARLRDAVKRFNPQRTALDLQRLRMDFPLPCPNGEGRNLSPAELDRLMRGRQVHFSPSLCTRYFTRQEGGKFFLTLFDDIFTLQKKIALAEHLGIRKGMVLLPEVEDILPTLFGEKEKS